MNENMRIYEQSREVPQEALKPIIGGRLKGMSDINPMFRIKKLTELFGICGIGWKIEIVDKRLEHGSDNEIVCFVDINLYIKFDGEWSAPIPGMGGSSFVTQEARGPYTSDECFKMAYTDAISVACKSLGFAADVYFAKDRTKYSIQEENADKAPEKQEQTKQTNAPTTQQTQSTSQPSASGLISAAQIKYAHTLKNKKKISEDYFKRKVAEHGNESLSELSAKQARELINFLTAIADPA